ncbi:branched-chain amino acid transaminase [Candidatus Peregrinibacteria bacterium]|nr:branched-chain amino acid transaminase [Candidatus Peregrinibacteria bacterium]
MQKTPYIWMNGKMIPWDDAKIHVLTHALHYGSAVFEGIRFYETPNGPAIFRLEDHTKRLFYSATTLEMAVPFTEKEVNEATKKVVAQSGEKSGYIRPIIYYGYGKMGLYPVGAPVDVAVACWSWGKYLVDRPVHAKISKYIRIHPRSLISDAKVTGHYVNSILASLEAHGEEYDEAILLDFEGKVAEGPGENVFVVKNGALFTPPLGKILRGITRDSIFRIAKDLGISVTEKEMMPEELFTADELFFTGTAAEVSPIGTLDKKKIGNGEEGPVTKKIREKFMEAVRGKDEKYKEWLTFLE